MTSGREWLRMLRALLAVVGVSFVIYRLGQLASQGDWRLFYAHPATLALILFLMTASMAAQFAIWMLLMNRHEPCLDWASGYDRFAASSVGRYLPVGKVWQFVALWRETDPRALQMHSIGSMMLSILCGLIAGMILVFLGLPSLPLIHIKPILGLAGLLVCVVAALCLARETWLQWLERLFNKWRAVQLVFQPITVSQVIRVVVLQLVFCWGLEGLAIVLMIRMTGSDIAFQHLLPILSGYAFSALGGYLIPLAPAGLGVREGIWFLFLKGHTPAAAAAMVILGTRFLLTVADAVFIVPFLVRSIRWR